MARLEQGELPLEESLRQFERGVVLTRLCQKALSQAEQKIRVLAKGAGGEVVEQDFDAAEAGLTGSDAGPYTSRRLAAGFRERVEGVLRTQSCRAAETRAARLHQAMRYAALGEGKRIRPLLVYAAGSAIGVARQRSTRRPPPSS